MATTKHLAEDSKFYGFAERDDAVIAIFDPRG
jgi:hypothetical protein